LSNKKRLNHGFNNIFHDLHEIQPANAELIIS